MRLCWALLSVVFRLPQSKAELLKFALAALAPCAVPCPSEGSLCSGCGALPAVSDHYPAVGAGHSAGRGGRQHLRAKVSSRPSREALPKPRDCSQGKGDLHQQSEDERWFFASSKLPLCLKGLSLMLDGRLTDLHISAIPECLLDFTV